jgi:hypothetical protein
MSPHREQREANVHAPALARRYGDGLRDADDAAAAAARVVDEALAAGLTPAAIQSLVIEPAMSCSTGSRSRAHDRDSILLAAAEGQHHVLDLRMIADVLEGAGFDVLYLGADVPVDALQRFVAEQQPAITGTASGAGGGRAGRRRRPVPRCVNL